jgi:hypothetical protein
MSKIYRPGVGILPAPTSHTLLRQVRPGWNRNPLMADTQG